MTLDPAPRRPLWQATLLGGLGPMLVFWLVAVAQREYVVTVLGRQDAHWLSAIGEMLGWAVMAFLSVQFLLFIIMTIAERRRVQPPVAWLCAGVAATTPLVVYSVWPNAADTPSWQILTVYFFGIAAAWITRRLRYGAWL